MSAIEELIQLIRQDQGRVREAVKLFEHYKGLKPPQHPLEWQSSEIPQKGYLDPDNKISYFLHGFGCTVKEVQPVAEIMRSHYQKIPMAVASGGERVVLEATLKNVDLHQFFDVVVSIDDVEKGKPEPDIFLLASQRLGIAPQECIVYEDSESGLEATRRAGMRSIDVRVLGQAEA